MKLARILCALMLILSMLALASCGNKDAFDTVYTYDEAILRLPDETVIRGKVEAWSDYSDGDQIQVTIDGVTYLVHSSNIVLISQNKG